MKARIPHQIAPSLLAADFAFLAEAVEMVNHSSADMLHLDIMDGRFVPNISFGIPVVRDVRKVATKPLDVHLMIVEPENYVEDFRKAGSDIITVHLEACNHLHRVVQMIKSTGAAAGVAVNPHTSVDLLDDILEDVDMVLVMSVNPGFGGQKFIYRTLNKLEQLREKIISRNLDVRLEVDGGVGLQNAEKILQAGADILVAGSSVFKADNPSGTIDQLKRIGRESMTYSV